MNIRGKLRALGKWLRDERVARLKRQFAKARTATREVAREANELEARLAERTQQFDFLQNEQTKLGKVVADLLREKEELENDLRVSRAEIALLNDKVEHMTVYVKEAQALQEKRTAIHCMELEAAKRGVQPREEPRR